MGATDLAIHRRAVYSDDHPEVKKTFQCGHVGAPLWNLLLKMFGPLYTRRVFGVTESSLCDLQMNSKLMVHFVT